MPDTARRQWLRWGALGAAALSAWALTGCAALQPGPRTIDISEKKLMEAIARQFPRSNRYLELFDVTLDTPRLRLMPAENRIGTQLDFTVGMPLVETRSQRGTLSLSYGLRLEASDNTVRLTDVRLENMRLPDVSPAHAARFKRLGGALVEVLLPDLVVHRLKPEDLEAVGRRGYQPGALRVVPGGLELRLDPLPR